MAGSTRLELATSGVTGQRSNQLNYDPASQSLYNYRNNFLIFSSPRIVSLKFYLKRFVPSRENLSEIELSSGWSGGEIFE